ncbi:hypothetical protein WH52_09510 [Tenacibaculum holothuriorum]|uniref:Transporter n=1 Tax=Tenacibaculum holothuriorum TaxID=1635173 RepID=A0A1Y2PB16_9FLAO|nr:hypothetical protein [Tenacibaculum holothuriorum]OSY87664.1 hypothetical protein WH52_09510 [Tenacibaculum holothuriorum]
MKSNVILSFLILYYGISQAQTLNDLLKKANDLYETTNSTLVFPKKNTSPLFPFNFSISEKRDVNYYQIHLKELESKQFKQDLGLVFKTNINYNFRDAFDEEQNTFNRFRLRTEVEWNIFKNGFTHNRTKSQQKQNEIEHLQLQSSQVKKQLWRRQFRIDYNYIANIEAIKLYSSFLGFENEYFDFLNTLYSKSLIKREQLIKVGNQIYILKNQLELIKKENQLVKDSVSSSVLIINKLPVFSIKTDSVFISKNLYNNSYLQENVRLNHKAINDLSLSIYVNQNFNASFTRSQYFPAVGIRFKAPIRFNKRQEIIKAKIQLLEAQEKDKKVGQYNILITQLNSYNEKLKDVQNQYKNWLVVEERIRILKLLKSELDSYDTGLLILQLTEEKFKILENIVQLKRQLYTCISHLFQLCPNDNIQEFLIPYSFENIQEKQTIIFDENNMYSFNFQYEFIKAKKEFSIAVQKDNIQAQQFLRAKNIIFSIVDKSTSKTISQLITEELEALKR